MISTEDTICVNQKTMEKAETFEAYKSEDRECLKTTLAKAIKGRVPEKVKGIFKQAPPNEVVPKRK